MNAITEIFRPFADEGQAVCLLSGRSLMDQEIDDSGRVISVKRAVRKYSYENYGQVMISYNFAEGIRYKSELYDKPTNEMIRSLLHEAGMMSGKADKLMPEQEFVEISRCLTPLFLKCKENNYILHSGKPVRVLFLFEFSSDLIPAEHLSVNQKVAAELIYFLSHSMSIRDSGSYVLFVDYNGGTRISDLVNKTCPKVDIPFPGVEEKKCFVEGLLKKYPNVKFDFDSTLIPALTAGTPNSSLYNIFRSANNTGALVSKKVVSNQRIKDVVDSSEGTIVPKDVESSASVDLRGSNVGKPMNHIKRCIQDLKKGSKVQPNILIVGPQSSGKTELVDKCAYEEGLPIYSLQSPKNQFVGETERLARLQQHIINAAGLKIVTIDEFTEAFITSRNQENVDGGASSAVVASLLSGLCSKDRETNTLFIAMSNMAWKVGAALLSRFVVIPSLSASMNDYPDILCAIAKSIDSTLTFDSNNEKIVSAANIFYQKRLVPRNMKSSLMLATNFYGGKLSPEIILESALHATPSDFESVVALEYADLYAVKLCSDERLLPWYDNPKYIFPKHISAVMEDGKIDPDKLQKELEKRKPYVNI